MRYEIKRYTVFIPIFLFLLMIPSNFISINNDNNIPKSSNLVRTINLDDSGVSAVTISENESLVYAGTYNANLFRYDPKSNSIIWEKNLEGKIEQIVASADHHYLVARTTENVYLFDWNGNTLLNLGFQCSDVDISADGNYFIFVKYLDNLFCYNICSSTYLWTYDIGPSLTNAEISDNGEFIVTSTGVGDVILLNNTIENPKSEIIARRFESEALIFDISSKFNDNYFTAIGLNNGSIVLINNMIETIWKYSPEEEIGAATAISISNNGNIVVVGTSRLQIYLFQGSNMPSYVYKVTDLVYGTTLIDLNSKATYFTTGTELGTVYLFSTDKRCGNPILTHSFGDGGLNSYNAILSIAIDSQQDRIAAGCLNNNLYIIERGNAICEEAFPLIPGFNLWMIIFISLGLLVGIYKRYKNY